MIRAFYRIFFYFLASILFSSALLFAQQDVSLVPREVFVGDEAVLSYIDTGVAASRFSEGLYELPAEALPDTDSVTIRSVVCQKTESFLKVEIRLVPWVAGYLDLPLLFVVDTVLATPQIHVSSILERNNTLSPQPARPPLLVPGTTWLVYVFIAVVGLIILFLYLIVFRILPRFVKDSAKRRAVKNKRRTLRALRVLEDRLLRDSLSLWYASLACVFRRYLAVFSGFEDKAFDASTSAEIINRIEYALEELSLAEDHSDFLQKVSLLLLAIDQSRFGPVDHDSRLDELSAVREIVKKTEVSSV